MNPSETPAFQSRGNGLRVCVAGLTVGLLERTELHRASVCGHEALVRPSYTSAPKVYPVVPFQSDFANTTFKCAGSAVTLWIAAASWHMPSAAGPWAFCGSVCSARRSKSRAITVGVDVATSVTSLAK